MTATVSSSGGIRVLLVEDVALEAKIVVRALADRGFADVVHFSDAESACAAVETGQPCIVVTDLELPKLSGMDLIRRVRARAGVGVYVYVIVLTGKSNPARIREAFDAGADDYMIKPFQREELIARVRVGERIVRLERAAYLRANELEAALRRIDEAEAVAALARAKALERNAPATGAEALLEAAPWEDLRAALRKGLVGFIGSAEDTVTSDAHTAIVGGVTLADPSRQLEVGLAVVVDAKSMEALCMQVLGEPGDFESGGALVLETANILMGSLKTLFSGRGYDFVLGLPTSSSLSDARSSHDSRAIRQRFAFACGDVAVDIWLFAAEKRNVKVRGRELNEGMVLAEDAHDPHGMLLVRAGVRLSETAASRLRNILGDRELVVASS